jgi:hypothetical protein
VSLAMIAVGACLLPEDLIELLAEDVLNHSTSLTECDSPPREQYAEGSPGASAAPTGAA